MRDCYVHNFLTLQHHLLVVGSSAGLVALLERGEFKQNDRVLFIHTGGLPSLFSHCELLG